ncbi:MAG TPA: hypothetical protein VEH57_00250 [Thermoplasmata archaeon]|nr:hypothetical protein [Thermoplasmata archaeon]
MHAIRAWFVSVVALLALTLALHHLGVDLSAGVANFLHGTEHLLGRPLISF